MSRSAARLVHLAALLVGLTGVLYGWMRYFGEPADEFALARHPWEPAAKAWHILTAPLLVFAVGLVWSAHVWARIAGLKRERRGTGIALAALLAPLVLSGYLLQTTESEAWRAVWVWTHGLAGGLWIVTYGVHQLSRRSTE